MTNNKVTSKITTELLIATLAYTTLAVIITWPVTANLNSIVGGFDGRDSFQHVWLFWWFWESLLNQHQIPATVTSIYFPLGANHPVLWIHALAPLFGLPLTNTVGPTATYNLVLLLSIILTGLTTYLLCRDFTKQPQAAFIGGLIFAFAPTRMGHTTAGHQLLAFGFVLPLFVLALWLWLKRFRWQLAALNAVALWLVLVSHPNFIGYFLLPITLVLVANHWWQSGRFSAQQWRQLLLSWAVAAVMFLPFAWPLAVDLFGQNLGFLTPDDVGEHSADLLSFITPSPFHPLWLENPPQFITAILNRPRALEEGFNYIGITTLALVVLAIWKRRTQARVWLVLGLITAVLSLGPALIVAGKNTQIPMPYALLVDLPFFSWSRTPGRLNFTTMLAVSVIAALGVDWLLSLVRQNRARWLITLALTAFICLDTLPMWPFPSDARSTPTYYHQLAQTQLNGGLLELPVTGSRRASNYAMFYQTTHRQPLAGGYIERDPPGTVELKEFLNQLVSPLPPQTVMTVPNESQRLAILADLSIAQVIAHPDLMTDSAARARLDYLPRLLNQTILSTDELRVYPVSPAPTTEIAGLHLLPDEENWEVMREGQALRLKKQGYLFVYASDSGCAALEFQVDAPGDPVIVAAQFNNTPLAAYNITPEQPWRADNLSLNKGLNYARLTTEPEKDVDFTKILVSAVPCNAPEPGAN